MSRLSPSPSPGLTVVPIRLLVAAGLFGLPAAASAGDPPPRPDRPFASPDGPPVWSEDRILRDLGDVARIDGVQLLEPDGHPVIVSDRRVDPRPLVIRTNMPIPIVTILDDVPADLPAASFAAIGVPRDDRLAHVRAVAPASLRQHLTALTGRAPAFGPPESIRPIGPTEFYIMQGRRDGAEVEPHAPPQVCASMCQWVQVPIGGEVVSALFEPSGDATDPIGAELWQYKVPEGADEGAPPRWVQTKPLGGGGGFRTPGGIEIPLP